MGYLVGYDSTNIYRIWVPSRGKVIRTRDVTFQKKLFYDPRELDSGHIMTTELDQIVEIIDMPEPSYTASRSLVNDDVDDPEPPLLPDVLGDADEDPIDATDGADEVNEEQDVRQFPTPESTPERILKNR